MTRPVITAENLGKRYSLGASLADNTLRDHLTHGLTSLLDSVRGRSKQRRGPEDFWALRDVNFEVARGTAVGIIGHNGAGKSTLLKVLSQITEPTTGEVRVRGRVASLLEVGTGFHPELSGRENIFMNGAMLGMTRKEIRAKFDEIVEFAEVGDFLDTPVKRYSSGMYVRLAFAVAAHLEPEILVVDEVLAVGDAAFQRKCLGKMENVADADRTVLFVSHNMVAVQNLCREVIWLDHGQVKEIGSPAEIVPRYLMHLASMSSELIWADPEEAPGNENVRLRRVAVCPDESTENSEITMETPFSFEVEFWSLKPDQALHVTLLVSTDQGVIAFGTNSLGVTPESGASFEEGLYSARCHMPGALMNSGMHRVTVMIVKDSSSIQLRMDDVLTFEIKDPPRREGAWFGKQAGVFRPRLNWKLAAVSDPVPQTSAR